MKAREQERQGIALIMVLVVIVLLSLGAYSFTELMLAQDKATMMSGRRLQARAAVTSGVEYLLDYLALDAVSQESLGGHYDNPAYFQDVIVGTEPWGTLRFSVVSILEDDYGAPLETRFGIHDEGARLNINEVANSDRYKNAAPSSDGSPSDATSGNMSPDAGSDASPAPPETDGEDGEVDQATNAETAQREVLMALPGMTEEVADAILDWIDEDDEPRSLGAESQYYELFGYQPRNGPIDSLDELLLVQGVTPELLYGADRNHNGMVDDSEQALATTMQGLAAMGSMDRGWSAFLTVASKDVPNQEEPIDLNQDDLEALFDELTTVFDADTATFIVAYRQSGPYSPPTQEQDGDDPNQGPDGNQGPGGNQGGNQPQEPPVPQAIGGRTVDLTIQGSNQFSSVLDLIGATTQARFEGEPEPVLVESPFAEDPASMATYLPDLMGNLTAGDSGGSGRINMNQGCQSVLSSIPPMTDTLSTSILGERDPSGLSTDPNYLYPTWPLAFGLTTLDEMKTLLPYVSVSGGVYRAQIVGYSEVPGVYARAEVVVDVSEGTPKLLAWRDLSHLGPGFPLDSLMTQ